jgi:GntR family transcriptional regulator, trigonelline degradation regulator
MTIEPEIERRRSPKRVPQRKNGDSREKALLGGGAGRTKPDPTPVRAQLAQELRRLITDGIYQAGDHMTERELCNRLGVSRPSVREALRQLEAEGLIDILPNRGPVVKIVSLSDLLEIWEVRTALETLIARRFARHGTEQQIEELDKAIRAFDAALRAQDVGRIKSTKTALFEAFAAGANSTVVTCYFRQVNARVSFVWSSSLMFPGRPAESISELVALLTAIRNRNPAAAEAAMLLHIEHGKEIALHGLRVMEENRRNEAANGGRRMTPPDTQ